MGLFWHLAEILSARTMTWEALSEATGLSIDTERSNVPPEDLALADLALLCRALGCQPGELLSFRAEDPTEQAQADLACNLWYQSLLAYRASQAEEGDGEEK